MRAQWQREKREIQSDRVRPKELKRNMESLRETERDRE